MRLHCLGISTITSSRHEEPGSTRQGIACPVAPWPIDVFEGAAAICPTSAFSICDGVVKVALQLDPGTSKRTSKGEGRTGAIFVGVVELLEGRAHHVLGTVRGATLVRHPVLDGSNEAGVQNRRGTQVVHHPCSSRSSGAVWAWPTRLCGGSGYGRCGGRRCRLGSLCDDDLRLKGRIARHCCRRRRRRRRDLRLSLGLLSLYMGHASRNCGVLRSLLCLLHFSD
mmetsp:Transcript_24299/g.57561  ORF Transcript_24299/g.57561 Transcript_24299/m.57561 type:complete len:225 (-) Transcript_24299:416-1090(-)